VDEIVPTTGFRDQLTLVLLLPVTVAVSCCVCDATREAVFGATVTLTVGGVSFRLALAEAVGLATLTAVTVMVWALATEVGAV
jgi:hypothetical protein